MCVLISKLFEMRSVTVICNLGLVRSPKVASDLIKVLNDHSIYIKSMSLDRFLGLYRKNKFEFPNLDLILTVNTKIKNRIIKLDDALESRMYNLEISNKDILSHYILHTIYKVLGHKKRNILSKENKKCCCLLNSEPCWAVDFYKKFDIFINLKNLK